MKKLLIFLTVILLNGICLEGENLLIGGDFEKGLSGWKYWGNGEVKIDRENKYDGKGSMCIRLKDKGSFYIQSNFFKVESKKLYILTLWYKADGFGTEKPEYHGASASSDIIFFTEEKKEIPRLNFVSIGAGYPWSLPFPYCNINPWQIGTLIVKAPEKASYAVYRIGLSSTNKEVLPSIWIDNIWIREYKPPEAKGNIYKYEAENMHIKNGEIVEDKKAEGGKAVAGLIGKNKKGTLIFGPYTKEQPTGQYKVVFRLKVDKNTENITAFVLRVKTNGFVNSTIYTKEVKASEFKTPGSYQDFSVDIVKPPTGWLGFIVSWSGEVNGWIDNIKVIEEKTFTDEDMEEFWK